MLSQFINDRSAKSKVNIFVVATTNQATTHGLSTYYFCLTLKGQAFDNHISSIDPIDLLNTLGYTTNNTTPKISIKMTKIVNREINEPAKFIDSCIALAILTSLYFTSHINYLLFHSLAEIFSIVIAFSVFVIAWNSKFYIKNQYLLFIGIAYLFIGIIDLLHTLSYKGMPIFTDYDFYANQLWIGARYLESISLLVAFYFLSAKIKIRPYLLVTLFTIASGLLIASIFAWKIFPECFVADRGLTSFKKISEYIICVILALNLYLLFKNRDKFDPAIRSYLYWAIIFTIIAELAFTFYISNYGVSNLIGHYFKIFSFFMIYLAIVKTGIKNPFDLIFLELDQANTQLHDEILIRTQTETDLKSALLEVKQLSGMLPICSSCKNIRDDKGYWRQIESFIKEHSEANFSHGICPDCVKKLYPEITDGSFKVNLPDARYTGLASRAYFDKILQKEWARCARDNKEISVIILDFRDVMRYEKSAILDIEIILRETLNRPTDYLAGYEENSYGIVLSDTNRQGARRVANNILNNFTAFRDSYRKSDITELPLRIAVLTTTPSRNSEPEALLSETNKVLKAIGNAGEDQIVQKHLNGP